MNNLNNKIAGLILCVLCWVTGYAQIAVFKYSGPLNTSVKKSQLESAEFLHDIVPNLWQTIVLPAFEYGEIEQRMKTQGYYSINTIIDYVSVEISITSKGKKTVFRSANTKLTLDQKTALKTIDQESDIDIALYYKYKVKRNDYDEPIKGTLTVTVVPEKEATYPGGYDAFVAYLEKTVFAKLDIKSVEGKLQMVVITFSVNENGLVTEVKMRNSSTDSKIDNMLLEALRGMPIWRPAKDENGRNVKQTISIPFSRGC